jgi:radical SAM superfamily enzyme YgiQ (UPF0313 family)
MYKDKKYRVRTPVEIKEDIRMAKKYYGDVEKVFLCDGDAIAIETDSLLDIIKTLYGTFPSLRHVSSYVGPQSTLSKSMAELKTLRAAGFTKAYLGVETGDDDLLRQVKKGVGYGDMLQAGRNLIEADINLSAMVLIGLAGKGEASRRHAELTAKICNEIEPQYLAALTLTPVPGTVLHRQVEAGDFELPDPFETLEEMKHLFEHITIDNLKFVGTHVSNYLPITGTLQKDKQKMIAMVDHVLRSRDKGMIRRDLTHGL